MPLLRPLAQRSDQFFGKNCFASLLCHFSDRSLNDPTVTWEIMCADIDCATSQTARSTIRLLNLLMFASDTKVPLLRPLAQRSDAFFFGRLAEFFLCHFSDRSLNDPTISDPATMISNAPCHFSDRSLNDPTSSRRWEESPNRSATSQTARSTIRQ